MAETRGVFEVYDELVGMENDREYKDLLRIPLAAIAETRKNDSV